MPNQLGHDTGRLVEVRGTTMVPAFPLGDYKVSEAIKQVKI